MSKDKQKATKQPDKQTQIEELTTDLQRLRADFENYRKQSEREKTAVALRSSLEELRTLAEAMPQIVWSTRADGWPVYFNQQWMDYTGLTLEESIGHGYPHSSHRDNQNKHDRNRCHQPRRFANLKFGNFSN